jgi:hypothetical protein
MLFKNTKGLVLIFFFLATLIPLHAQDSQIREYELKAAFIYRFIDYVDWENASENETFDIAVLGKNPITSSLINISKDKKVKGKTITVKEYQNLDEMGFCNILFIPDKSSYPIEKILSKYEGKPVLIISENEGYGKKGTHFNFVMVENKLKFQVNLKAIKRSGIIISSFLLQHAIIVD